MTETGGQALQQVLFFGVLIVGFYLLAIRPQRARARALAQVRAGLEVGNRVITTAGIHATVAAIGTDDTVVLEIAEGVQVVFASAAVVRRLDEPGTEPGSKDEPSA